MCVKYRWKKDGWTKDIEYLKKALNTYKASITKYIY